jgi:hypothetical protein
MKNKPGHLNPMFGKRWLNKDGQVILVPLEKVELCITLGWLLGKRVKVQNEPRPLIPTNRWNWFDEQADQILVEFDVHQSISKILSKRGFIGRAGNARLSNWLKQHGRSPKQRRNSIVV